MKKFTCLLIALLAINAVYTQNCAANLADHTFYLLANQAAYGGTGTGLTTNTGVANAAGYCNIATGTKLCCTQAGIKTTVNNELKFIRDSLINYAAGVARVGAMWSKISTLVGATNTSTLIDAASAPERSGATADQIKTWIKYDNVTFDTDFKGFKDNAVKCFESYALAANAVACDGCTSQSSAWDDAAILRWTQDSTISITATTCDALVTNCARVWYFMHRFGWFAQSVALVNKKRESTSGSVTYSAVDYTELYAPGVKAVAAGSDTTNFPALTVIGLDALNTAITACGGAATATSACDAATKVTVCRSFFSLYTQGKNFGRSDTTFIGGTYNPVSTVARRELVALITGTTGATRVSDQGLDGTVATAVVDTTTNKIDSTAVSAWSTGYSSSSGSSSSASSKSAKVFIGTILSALFAVAFLN